MKARAKGEDKLRIVVLGVDLNIRCLVALSTYKTICDSIIPLVNKINKLKNQISTEDDDYKRYWLSRDLQSEISYLNQWSEIAGARVVAEAKRLVEAGDCCVIVLEDLNFEKLSVSEEVKSAWKIVVETIRQRGYEDKIKVDSVDPGYTSQLCICCGRVSEYNRFGDTFRCQWCDYTNNADDVAAKNVGIRFIHKARKQRKETSKRSVHTGRPRHIFNRLDSKKIRGLGIENN